MDEPRRVPGTFNPAHDAQRVATQGNPWIEQTDMMDTVALLLNGFAKRCGQCQRPARMKHLNEQGLCPDCREIT